MSLSCSVSNIFNDVLLKSIRVTSETENDLGTKQHTITIRNNTQLNVRHLQNTDQLTIRMNMKRSLFDITLGHGPVLVTGDTDKTHAAFITDSQILWHGTIYTVCYKTVHKIQQTRYNAELEKSCSTEELENDARQCHVYRSNVKRSRDVDIWPFASALLWRKQHLTLYTVCQKMRLM